MQILCNILKVNFFSPSMVSTKIIIKAKKFPNWVIGCQTYYKHWIRSYKSSHSHVVCDTDDGNISMLNWELTIDSGARNKPIVFKVVIFL